MTGLFRADPTRTDEPVLVELLRAVQPGETWLDIGAGAGRYALPLARALARSGGSVTAVDPSRGMLDALRETAAEHAIDNVRVVEGRWPDVAPEAGAADVALIAHVSYDIAEIGPFLAAMEAAARRLCVAVLMERQPSSIADVCWPSVWGEERVPLPALPEFVERLRAPGRRPVITMLEREPRRFASRDELEGFLRRQLWVADGVRGRGALPGRARSARRHRRRRRRRARRPAAAADRRRGLGAAVTEEGINPADGKPWVHPRTAPPGGPGSSTTTRPRAASTSSPGGVPPASRPSPMPTPSRRRCASAGSIPRPASSTRIGRRCGSRRDDRAAAGRVRTRNASIG